MFLFFFVISSSSSKYKIAILFSSNFVFVQQRNPLRKYDERLHRGADKLTNLHYYRKSRKPTNLDHFSFLFCIDLV